MTSSRDCDWQTAHSSWHLDLVRSEGCIIGIAEPQAEVISTLRSMILSSDGNESVSIV